MMHDPRTLITQRIINTEFRRLILQRTPPDVGYLQRAIELDGEDRLPISKFTHEDLALSLDRFSVKYIMPVIDEAMANYPRK